MSDYVIKSTSISFYQGPIYWTGIPGEGSNWVHSLSDAERMDKARAKRLLAVLRDYELVVKLVKLANRKTKA